MNAHKLFLIPILHTIRASVAQASRRLSLSERLKWQSRRLPLHSVRFWITSERERERKVGRWVEAKRPSKQQEVRGGAGAGSRSLRAGAVPRFVAYFGSG